MSASHYTYLVFHNTIGDAIKILFKSPPAPIVIFLKMIYWMFFGIIWYIDGHINQGIPNHLGIL